MYYPINRKRQFITQKFKSGHRGIDLRCVDDKSYSNLDVTATERAELIRQGQDGYGNYFVVLQPLEYSGLTDIKYIHLNRTTHEKGKIFEAGEKIGMCIVGGNSPSLHLHFETWNGKTPVDPLEYFDAIGIEYDVKDGA